MPEFESQLAPVRSASPPNDPCIRRALVDMLTVEDPSATILHELPLARGEGRADVVCVNGITAAFEIKSHRDSLRRLTDQCLQYERAFDESSVVVAPRHLLQVRRCLPRRWGIFVTETSPNKPIIRCVRPPKENHHHDPDVLVRILWKTECLGLLRHMGVRTSPSTPILKIWAQLAELPMPVLRAGVRGALKRRKAVPPLFRCGGSRTTGATE